MPLLPKSRAKISIHALVKRATAISLTRTEMSTISIHALVKRATHRFAMAGEAAVISIHALVKRATLRCLLPHLIWIFQSTPS